jgi:Peptidase family M28
VLNGRIYRAAFVPLLFAVVIAGFSLSPRPAPLGSTLAPDAFDGASAFASLQSLAARFPQRRPGSAGDDALAAEVARSLRELGGTSGGGFTVRTSAASADTIDGPRTLQTVIAERPGAGPGTPIVLLAHRDAAGRGASAELSGTAVLLELARVFAVSETQRTVILVSTSGGSGGAAGAAGYAAALTGQPDAAIVLGDLAGARARKPFVEPFASGPGSAPDRLQRTVEQAIAQEVGVDPGGYSVLSQLAHQTLPLTVGEEGPLNAYGVPAVLVQVSGERGPGADEPVSATRLQDFGRGILAAVYALDGGPDVPGTLQRGLAIQQQLIPAWAIRLLLGALLLPPLLVGVDGLARLRRRGEPVARWVGWVLACAAPFLLCALFALGLGRAGALIAPPAPVLPGALPFHGAALRGVLAVGLALLLAWVLWPLLVRRAGLRALPDGAGAGLALLLVLLAVSVAVWVLDPFALLLLLPALHLWLVLVSPEWLERIPFGRRALGLLVVALGVLPLLAVLALYSHELGLGAGDLLHMGVVMFAAGTPGVAGFLLWSLAFGCLAAAVLLVLAPRRGDGFAPIGPGGGPGEHEPITVRGPGSYAGPGSLGGTESALRR